MIPVLHGVFGAGGGAAGGFESIATVTAAGGETTLSFTSIPGTYVALQIRGSVRTQGSTALVVDYLMPRLNSNTGSNYSYHQLHGDGASVFAGPQTNMTLMDDLKVAGSSATSNVFGGFILDLHDYASTTRNKTLRAMAGVDNNGSGEIHLDSGLWRSTSAVNAVSFTTRSGNTFAAGSVIALYGINGA